EREEQVDYEGQGRAGEKITDVLQLADARHGIADTPRLEIRDGQRHQMSEQPSAELDIDAIGRMREQIGAQRTEHRLEYRDGHQADDQHLEGAHAPVHQHLVDHDLEEQRADQREDLKKQRGYQDFGEQTAILVDGAQEPG